MNRRKVKPYFSPDEFAKKAKRGFAFFEAKTWENPLVFPALFPKKGLALPDLFC
jgi:hypothetical protein